jgi:hypothetical protein
MSQLDLNSLGVQVRDTLLEKHPEWEHYVDVLASGDLELAVPAPQHSRAGHLVVFTNQGKDIWVRYSPGQMCYSVDSLRELHAVIEALVADDAFFVVVTRGDEWVETTLLRPGQEPVLVEGQVANIVSWSGRHDRILTFVGSKPPRASESRS